MTEQEKKDMVEQELLAIGKENMDALLKYMQENGYYTQRCHRHHHYAGGLADHAIQTMRLALAQWETDKNTGNADAIATNRESITIAALLHDLCDVHGPYNMHGHGRKSAAVIKAVGVHLTYQEFLAIRFHMSLKGKENHPRYEDACHSYLRLLIHRADGRSAGYGSGSESHTWT